MKVVIGGECSGVIRDAFLRLGHEAISCDLKPTEAPGPHYQGDIFDIIDFPWDMGIFHPECTHTAVSGARHFKQKKFDGRYYAAVSFFMRLEKRTAHIPKTVFEHSVSVMSSLYREPDQIIQPHWFGHPESKATCLWLKGLDKLQPTNKLSLPSCGYWNNQTPSGQNKLGPSDTRAADRARTYLGIADAMALQYGGRAASMPQEIGQKDNIEGVETHLTTSA